MTWGGGGEEWRLIKKSKKKRKRESIKQQQTPSHPLERTVHFQNVSYPAVEAYKNKLKLYLNER